MYQSYIDWAGWRTARQRFPKSNSCGQATGDLDVTSCRRSSRTAASEGLVAGAQAQPHRRCHGHGGRTLGDVIKSRDRSGPKDLDAVPAAAQLPVDRVALRDEMGCVARINELGCVCQVRARAAP